MRQKIPANISEDHILLAMNELDKKGVPKKHQSTKFDLSYNGKNYPPKYIIRTANIFANGEPFETELFSGGNEANTYLEKLGFTIQQKTFSWTIINSYVTVKNMDKSSFIHHGTGIPIEIRKYFELHDIVKGHQYPVNLVYQDKVFQAVISADNQPNPRTRLFWHEDFSSVIRSIMPSWYQYFLSHSDSSESPEMRFIKTGQPNKYQIDFIDPKEVQKDIDEDIEKEINLLESLDKPKNPEEFKNPEEYKEYIEGRRKLIQHVTRERNVQVIKKAKENFKSKNNRLYCEICGFDFENQYGKIGRDYIEGHHILPISQIVTEYNIIRPEEIALVCSNCHRILHRKKPWLTVEELKKLIN